VKDNTILKQITSAGWAKNRQQPMLHKAFFALAFFGLAAGIKVHSKDASRFALHVDHLRGLWNQNPASTPGTGTSAFVSNDGLLCVDGPSRKVEAALAIKKAGLKGALFNETFAHKSQTCSSLGFSYSGGADSCSPGVMTYHRDQAAQATFAEAEATALAAYRAFWNLETDDVNLMAQCTCEPGSAALESRTESCDSLNQRFTGSWIHHDHHTQAQEICDGGPFTFATFAMAVLKSSGQLPMHQFDQIAPVECTVLGFPYRYAPPDHCFTSGNNTLHIYMQTPEIRTDPGIKMSQATEGGLFGGGFRPWAEERNLDSSILFSQPGCNCFPGSEVYNQVGGPFGACAPPEKHPPVNDWWNGDLPGLEDPALKD